METRTLDKSEWADELIRLWRAMDGKEVMVEVEALKLGDQIEAEHVPLKGLSYDPKDDVVQMWVGDIGHTIHCPTKIDLAYADGKLSAIDITDTDGEQHLLRLKQPVSIL